MKLNEKGQEVYGPEDAPKNLGIRTLTRPLSPREEMQRMIIEYDNLRKTRAVRVDPHAEEDALVQDPDGNVPDLTDAEMEYQLSVAAADARRRERIEEYEKKRASKPIQDPPDPARPDPQKDPGQPTPGVQGKEKTPEKA